MISSTDSSTISKAVPPRVALITSSPDLVQPLLNELQSISNSQTDGVGPFTVPLVIKLFPSMRLSDRVRDLSRTIRLRARMNRTNFVAQLAHHFAYKRVIAATRHADDRPESREPHDLKVILGQGRHLMEAFRVNDTEVIEALRGSGCELGLVVGSGVISKKTLQRVNMPLYNIHLADPAFVRGRPPVFWEVLAEQETVGITLHEIVPKLDAGRICAQAYVPMVWKPTLGETIQATRAGLRRVLPSLVLDALPKILNGSLQPRVGTAGPLRTTPTIGEVRRAKRICRRRRKLDG